MIKMIAIVNGKIKPSTKETRSDRSMIARPLLFNIKHRVVKSVSRKLLDVSFCEEYVA